MPVYNYSKLLGRIREKQMTQEEIAEKIDRNVATFNRKVNHLGYFTQAEISKICDILEITDSDIPEYFFTKNLGIS